MPRRMVVDRWLFITSGVLVLSGLVMVGSASHYVAMSQGLHPYHYLLRHVIHLIIGAGFLAAALSVPYDRLSRRKLAIGLVVASLVALIVVLAMPASGGTRPVCKLSRPGRRLRSASTMASTMPPTMPSMTTCE